MNTYEITYHGADSPDRVRADFFNNLEGSSLVAFFKGGDAVFAVAEDTVAKIKAVTDFSEGR